MIKVFGWLRKKKGMTVREDIRKCEEASREYWREHFAEWRRKQREYDEAAKERLEAHLKERVVESGGE